MVELQSDQSQPIFVIEHTKCVKLKKIEHYLEILVNKKDTHLGVALFVYGNGAVDVIILIFLLRI